MTNHHWRSTWIVCVGLFGAGAATAPGQQVIVDNTDAGFTILSGSWNTGSFSIPWLADYRWADTAPGGTNEVEWRPTLPTAGTYRVDVWYVQGGNRAVDAPFVVHHTGGSTPISVNQQTGGGQWSTIGTFSFAAGTAGYVTLSNDAGPSVVIADAVRFTVETAAAPDEFRGMWMSRFDLTNPGTSLAAIQSTITSVMSKLQSNNFNAVLLQVRGQADTLYPSPNEPWSPLVSSDGDAPSGWGTFDPLAFAITEAHNRDIEFHAYINTHVAWQAASSCGSSLEPSYAPDHVFFDHFDASNANARDWLVHDDLGDPVQCEESNYTWIAPGVPDAMAYVREQVMYVVENYDVDGIHFDRIRTPGTEYSHDPISEARRLGEGNPDSLGFADWTRNQITRFNIDIYAQIMEVKPWVKVSSAPLGLYESSRYPGYPAGPCGYFYGFSCVYQDAQAWLAAGAQDFIVPQIYWADNGSNPEFSEILPDWVTNNAGRHIYAGQLRSVGVTELISQIGATRTLGGEGNVVFSYGSFNSNNYWPDYSNAGGPYESTAPVPEMSWKASPTQGIIIGNVFEADGVTPIVDCNVTRTGSSYTALSSGDGLYAFLKTDPGTYTLTFDKLGVGTREVCDVTVVAGEVTRLNTTLGGPFVPGDFDGDGDADLVDFPLTIACLAGPDQVYPADDCCLSADADADLDVDLADVALIQPVQGQ